MSRKTFDFGQTLRGTTFAFPNDLAGRRCAVFGMSGYGKSNSGAVCVEGLVRNGEQMILVDPKGEGWGLTSSADGRSEGLDVIIFGQPFGDIEELDESHGEHLADFAVDTGRSIVLSLLAFDTDQSERRFVTRFMKRLFRRKTKQQTRSRTLIVMDESQLFMPEGSGSGHKGDMAQLVGAIQRIALQGRSFGLGCMALAQRPQNVAKRAVSQSELLIVHNLSHNRDRKALAEWTEGFGNEKQREELLATVSQLEPGEAWVWSPAWLKVFERVNVNRRSTFDSGATPDGSAASSPSVRTQVDLDALRENLSEVIDRAKADDPKELKRQVADLQKQLKHAEQQPVVDESAIEDAVRQAVELRDKEWGKQLQVANDALLMARGQIEAIQEQAKFDPEDYQEVPSAGERMWDGIVDAVRPQSGMVPTGSGKHGSAPRRTVNTRRPTEAHPGFNPTARDELDGPSRKILDAIAWWWSVNEHQPTSYQVAFVAGYSPKGGSFNTYLSRLSSAGIIERASGTISLTDIGFSAIERREMALPSLGEYHGRLRSVIKQGPLVKIVDALIGCEGCPVATDDLGEMTGYTASGGSFNTYLSRLSSLGLIERRNGIVRPTNLLMPESLA